VAECQAVPSALGVGKRVSRKAGGLPRSARLRACGPCSRRRPWGSSKIRRAPYFGADGGSRRVFGAEVRAPDAATGRGAADEARHLGRAGGAVRCGCLPRGGWRRRSGLAGRSAAGLGASCLLAGSLSALKRDRSGQNQCGQAADADFPPRTHDLLLCMDPANRGLGPNGSHPCRGCQRRRMGRGFFPKEIRTGAEMMNDER